MTEPGPPAVRARQHVGMSATPSVCPRCSTTFVCAVDSGACWCASLDINQITQASLAQYYNGCLCRECLQALEDARPQLPSVREFLAGQLKRKIRRRR